MLKILSMKKHANNVQFSENDTPDDLYHNNHSFTFFIEAPLYWWIDFDKTKFGFELANFSEREKHELPLSTPVKAYVYLFYQEIVEICLLYLNQEFVYENAKCQWNNEREWNDFCETLLDIKGVRDLIKEET